MCFGRDSLFDAVSIDVCLLSWRLWLDCHCCLFGRGGGCGCSGPYRYCCIYCGGGCSGYRLIVVVALVSAII